jgi:DNA anti-recombination protein RmuC
MTLQTISLVHKWYEVASRFEKSRAELAKAQKSFDFFRNQFENVGKNLSKAQEAFETAQRHLKTYRRQSVGPQRTGAVRAGLARRTGKIPA